MLFAALVALVIGWPPTAAFAQGQMPATWQFTSVSAGESVAYSPDGTLIAVGGPGGVELYSAATSAAIRGLQVAAGDARLCFSPDGKTLLVGGSGSNGLVQLWNVSTGALVASLTTGMIAVEACAYSPDGTKIAVGGWNSSSGVLEIWSAATNKQTAVFPTKASAVYSLAFSRDGKILADGGSGSSGGFVESWNAGAGTLLSSFSAASIAITTVAISPDDSTVAVGGNGYFSQSGTMQLHSVETGELIFYIATSAGSVTSIAYSPDGKTLADTGLTVVYGTQSIWPSSYGTIETWSLVTGTLIARAKESDELLSLAFSPSGAVLAAGGVLADEYPALGDGAGSLYTFSVPNLAQESSVVTGSGGSLVGLPAPVYSPDGSKLVGGGVSATGYPNLWNASNGSWLAGLGNLSTGTGPVYAYSPNGKSIAVASVVGNETVFQIFDATTYQVASSFTYPSNVVSSLAYSPDGTKLAVGLELFEPFADAIVIFELPSGAVLETLQSTANGATFPVAFSSDGKMIADGGQIGGWTGVAEIWNVATGKLTCSLPTNVSEPFGVAFSPDEKSLAVAGQTLPLYDANPYGNMEIWNVSSQDLTSTPTLAPGSGQLATPVFAPNGKTLYVGSNLGVQVFDTADYGLLGYFLNSAQYVALSADGTHLAYESVTGNIAVAPVPTTQSYPISSVALNPASVAGGASAVGTVTLSEAAPAGGVTLEVFVARFLENDISTIFIPAGSKTGVFTVSTTIGESQTSLPVTLSSGPYSKTVDLSVTPLPPTISSLVLSPTSAVGGSGAQVTVNVSSAIIGNQVPIYLSSNNPAVSVLPLIYIFQGRTQVSNSLSTIPVNATTVATVTAKLGTSTQTAQFTVYAASLSQISVPSSSLQGDSTESGTVTLNGATASKGAVVTLSSSDPAAVTVPSSVTIKAGASKGAFTVTANPVSTETAVTITAKMGSVTQTVTVNVLPASLLSVSLNPSTVVGGNASVGAVTLNGPAGPSGAVVSLTSSLAGAVPPATVTIPAGKTSATFKITTKPTTSKQTATISAALNSVKQTATLTINP